MCRVLEVSKSGYYDWRKEERTPRDEWDDRLKDLIKVLHAKSFGGYGARRIVTGLKQQGIIVNIKKIRRLMRKIGIKGKSTPKKRIITTDSNHDNPVAKNLVDRKFTVDAPNKVWVTDITYIWTEQGWVYLAIVIDLFSRMVVGWSVDSSINIKLISRALEIAFNKRKPLPGLLLHSDRGSQYTSNDYRLLAHKFGMTLSMSRKANCWDNAVAESFFRTIKTELIKNTKINSLKHAYELIFNYIENFYNSCRLHSYLLYKSPLNFESEVILNPDLLLKRQNFLKKSVR